MTFHLIWLHAQCPLNKQKVYLLKCVTYVIAICNLKKYIYKIL